VSPRSDGPASSIDRPDIGLDFGGQRRIDNVLYIASITQQRDHDDSRRCIARKIAEGKISREARRAHKRLLVNRVSRRQVARRITTLITTGQRRGSTRERPTVPVHTARVAGNS
jgi:hypothetical protein